MGRWLPRSPVRFDSMNGKKFDLRDAEHLLERLVLAGGSKYKSLR